MALPVTAHLEIYRGDTWSQTFKLTEADTPKDLSSATVECWATSLNGKQSVPLAVLADASGNVTISQVTDLKAGNYVYDVEVSEGGATTTWVRGNLTVTQDVTNA